jgi:proteasome assembly chaperone (PAC2) family protein
MSDLATFHAWPALERPVLVVALDGWIDAGAAGQAAMSSLQSSMPTKLMATFDADELIDHRSRRPVLRIDQGVNTEVVWPEIQLHAATAPNGRSLLLLSGPEPDMRWHRFIDEVVRLVARLGVELVIGLGAFPSPVPHTRPVRLVATATSAELAAQVGFLPASIEVPSGMQGVLEHALGDAGVDAVTAWARVPHYASAMPYPAASAALVEQVGRLVDIEVDASALLDLAASTNAQINRLISASDDHAAMVAQLEAQHDSEEGGSGIEFGELPSGDQIAAELERFLRGLE